MKKIIFILLPIFAFAAEVNIAESDIVYRSINFVIFVAILWYLLANPIKSALKARQDNIASQLSLVQEKLLQSKVAKEEALKSLENAKKRASDIIDNAKKEAIIIEQNMEKQYNSDVAILRRNYEERLNFEQKKMKKNIINEILDELLTQNHIKIDKKEYVDILLKRVA